MATPTHRCVSNGSSLYAGSLWGCMAAQELHPGSEIIDYTPWGAPPVVVAPVVAPVAAPERRGGYSVTATAAGSVSPMALARIEAQCLELEQAGFVVPPPVYAPGSRTRSDGDDRLRILRAAWEEQPETAEVLESIRDRVRAEQREVVTATLGDVSLCPLTGDVMIAGDRVRTERNGFAKLLSLASDRDEGGAFPRGASLMGLLSPALRSCIWDERIPAAGMSDKRVKLLTRQGPDGGRALFGVVGERYAVHSIDQYCEDMLAGLPRKTGNEGMRAEGVYDPAAGSLHVTSTWHAKSIADLGAGDHFSLGWQARASDIGGGSVQFDLAALRNLCLNLKIVAYSTAQRVRKVHKGDMSGVAGMVAAAMQEAEGHMDRFASDWGILRNTDIGLIELWGRTFRDVPTALSYAVESGRIGAGIARDTLTQVLLTGWEYERGSDLAAMIDAVTRSHMSTLLDRCQASRLEREAGELVLLLRGAAGE